MKTIKASNFPPMFMFSQKRVDIKVIDTVVFEFLIEKKNKVKDFKWGFLVGKDNDFNLFMGLLSKEIKKHEDFKYLKLKRNQVLNITCIRSYLDMKIVEVHCDIIEFVDNKKYIDRTPAKPNPAAECMRS